VQPSSARVYTIRLTNDPNSPQSAQRARIGIPSGFSVSSMTATTSPAGNCVTSTWESIPIVNGIAEFKKPGGGNTVELCPGGTLTISITASAPTEGVWTWTTELIRDTPYALLGSQPGVRVDGTAPAISIDSSPSDPSNDSSPSFAFSADEPAVAFECKLDDGAFGACTSPRAYGPLPDGTHVFELRGTDAAGNVSTTVTRSWTIATVAPLTTIDSAPPAYSNSASASFSFSTSVSGSTFECKLDDGQFEACSSPKIYESLPEGPHNFQVQAKDPASNQGSPIGHSWVVDTRAPASSIQTHPALLGKVTTATFGFTSDEIGATFRCKLDEGAFGECASPKTYTSLTDRTHTFAVEATDRAGNVGSSATFTWTVDSEAPNTSITANPPAASASASASFSFTSTEPGSTFECMLNAQAWGACTSPQSYSGLPDGAQTFAVRATDGAGNVDQSPSSVVWTIDTAAPDTTIVTKPLGLVNSATANFTFSATETGATFECKLDAEPSFTACGASKTYTSLSDGQHVLAVLARDGAGNPDPTPASHTWTVDTVAPDTTIVNGPPDPSASGVATFTFTSSEPNSTFECKIDTSLFLACSSPAAYSLLDGTHTFQVRARDAAGNTDSAAATRTWRIDTVEPDTAISSKPPAVTSSQTATFEFSSPDAGVTFECSIDSAAFAACTSPQTYSGLLEGQHTFAVRARDTSSNIDQSPATHAWTIDRASPETSILTPPASPINDPTPTFMFSASEAATFECRIDAAPFAACTSPHTTTALTDGAHTFAVQARDTAGNVDATPATRTFTVDTVPPETRIDSGPSGPSNDSTPTFEFSSPDPTATFECQLDGGAYATCTSPTTLASLSDGPHTFNVRARDSAGNVDATPDSRAWTVETVAPAPTITLPIDGSATNDPTPGFAGGAGNAVGDSPTVTVRLYAGPVVTASALQAFSVLRVGANWSGASGILAEGVYTARAEQTDVAGNTGYSAPTTFTVDTGGPGAAITARPTNPTASGTATFQFSSTDPLATFKCRLDAAADFAPCSNPITYEGLGPGTHVFAVNATDRAGNTGGTATYSWTIVALPPPPAPPEPPPPPPVPPSDTVAPHEVASVRAKAADATVTLTWALPPDSDFDRVSVTRTASGKGARALTIYQGRQKSLIDRRLKNGVRYRYRITTHDRAGNSSAGVVVAATPLAPLLAPQNGGSVTAPPVLQWQAVPRATYYNVQLWLVQSLGPGKRARPGKVLSAWPSATRLPLKSRWSFDGKAYRLIPGRYRWYVFPGFGKRSAVRYGALLGQSTFTVSARNATKH
jgi:large repetitive protein